MSRSVVILRIDDEVAIPGAIATTPDFDLATVDDGDSQLLTFGASVSVSAAGARQTWAVANRGRGRAASMANLHGDPRRFTEVTSASRSPPLVQRGDGVERGQDLGFHSPVRPTSRLRRIEMTPRRHVRRPRSPWT